MHLRKTEHLRSIIVCNFIFSKGENVTRENRFTDFNLNSIRYFSLVLVKSFMTEFFFKNS